MNRTPALAILTIAAASALAGCQPATVSKAAAPPPASTQAPPAAAATMAAPSPTPSTAGPVGTTFTVTSSDGTSYDVTLDEVTQFAALSPYETLDNPADHAAAAEFTITGDTGQSSDDANSDANAIGSDQTEYQATFISLTVPNFNSGEFEVAPGETEKGWVAYEIPPGVTVAQVQWAPSFSGAAATWTVGSQS